MAAGEDGRRALERLASTDAAPEVREQAVLAYQQLEGAESVAFLKQVALDDTEPQVVSAALESLRLVAEEHPTEPRADLDVQVPTSFERGATFDVHVRIATTDAAPRAMVGIELAKGFALADDESPVWKGSLEATSQRDLVFHVRAPATNAKGALHVRLKADYAERLDLEVHDERLRMQLDERGGSFAPLPSVVNPGLGGQAGGAR